MRRRKLSLKRERKERRLFDQLCEWLGRDEAERWLFGIGLQQMERER